MIFILIRIFPFLLPVIYWALLKLIFLLDGRIFWPILISLSINFLYFLFIFIKKNKVDIFILFLHSSIVIMTGFFYVLILSSQFFINSFLLFWSLLYFLYLESIFHYFYETKKVLILDLKNIIAYTNLITFFCLTAFLINLYIFINFSLWLVFTLVIIFSFLLVLSRLRVNGILWKKSLIYSLSSSIMVVEVLTAVLFLSVSFYVSAVILTILYYLLNSLLVLHAKDNLTKTVVWQYLIFTLIAIFIISLTSQWL